MRITGGSLRGRVVKVPPGEIRPTMDRMRESMFSILGPLHGRSFLDLFGGSGIVALEAVSRGADPVVTVEKDRGKRHVLLENLSMSTTAIEAHFVPAERYVKATRTRHFDILYLDPPFRYRHSATLLSEIARSRIVTSGTLILIHHPRANLGVPEGLFHRDTRMYGGSQLDFFGLTPE
ncbi:MAG: 16S rRNA (guanine(966)-N(2))-methyltransferase RsmD [Spirochaetaceae bacterium]